MMRGIRLCSSSPLFLLTVFLLAQLPVLGQDAEALFVQANLEYREEDFGEAIRLYEQIKNNGWESGELYYNLGNAYFRESKLGPAILNYERARGFLPGDSDLSRNLEIANLRIVDKIEPLLEFLPVRWMKAFLRLFPARSWVVLGLAFYWCAILSIVAWRLLGTSSLSRWLVRAAISSALAGVISAGLLTGRIWLDRSQVPAVVMVPEVEALSAPAAGATEVFRIHEGTRLRIGTRSSDWSEIILPDGKVGWIPSQAIELVKQPFSR